MINGISGKQNLTLKLMVDEEKNKVIIASCDRDFVDVLFSLMTLPMGTIVRLLKWHHRPEIGCFSNLYKSVEKMGIENFNTEACMQMLLNPRSMEEANYKRLKININPTDDLKYYACRNVSICNLCSNFKGSVCKCRELMNKEIELSKDDQSIQNNVDEGFLKGRSKSSFIITDDLKVYVDSIGLLLKTLDLNGYSDVSKLGERIVDVGIDEIVTLVGYMFSSSTPLTNTFLKKQSPLNMTNDIQVLSPCVGAETNKLGPEFTVDAIVRKQDMKILYVECGEDFVDLLFTFLAVPLGYLWDINLGCTANFRRSFKKENPQFKCVLPYYYKCHNQFADITFEEPPVYYRYFHSLSGYCLTTNPNALCCVSDIQVSMIDPKSHGIDQLVNGNSGFVKRGKRYIVSDDLIITPLSYLSSSISILKKLQFKASDLDVQEVKIRKEEAMRLLSASIGTSSALNTAWWDLIVKKPKEERPY